MRQQLLLFLRLVMADPGLQDGRSLADHGCYSLSCWTQATAVITVRTRVARRCPDTDQDERRRPGA